MADNATVEDTAGGQAPSPKKGLLISDYVVTYFIRGKSG
jgi:hypothetical protein